MCGSIDSFMLNDLASSPHSLLVAGALTVLYHTWRGWRLGIIRQCVKLVGFVTGITAGYFAGPLLVPLLRPAGFPDALLLLLGSAGIWISLYLAISLVSSVIFKKTSQQSLCLIRWGYGGLGALAGAAYGLFLVFVFLVMIRLAGAIAQIPGTKPGGHPAGRGKPAPGIFEMASESVVQIKRTLDDSPLGKILERLDPVPTRVYTSVGKVGQLVGQEGALERFREYSGVKKLWHHPKIEAIQADPEVMRAILAHDYGRALSYPKVAAALNDPEIIAFLKGLEFEKALDYALQRPENRELAPGTH
jgi:uncharacterized membrane protein required for colicin V production